MTKFTRSSYHKQHLEVVEDKELPDVRITRARREEIKRNVADAARYYNDDECMFIAAAFEDAVRTRREDS